jgi:hypothetical protein
MTGAGGRASGHWRYRLLRPAAALAGLALLAACSGSPPAGSAGSSPYQQGLAYAQCMRSHGVANFPDPNSEGRFIISSQVVNGVVVQGVDQTSPQFISANKTCQKLLPRGGQETPAQHRQQMSELLRLAQCMRAHGIPDFPDPTADGSFSYNSGDPARVHSQMLTCMTLTHFGQGAP